MTYRAKTAHGAARIARAHLAVIWRETVEKPLTPLVRWLNDRLS